MLTLKYPCLKFMYIAQVQNFDLSMEGQPD